MANVLIIEDKASFGEVLKASLEDVGITVNWAKTGREALQRFRKEKFDIGLIDLRLPDLDGIDLLKELKKIDRETSYVIMTAFGTIERAVEAMKLGACDFLTKPFDMEQLIALFKKILDEKKCYYENILLKDIADRIFGFPEIVGKSAAINSSIELLQKVANTDTTVLLLGESGTGKELFARACHVLSPRKDNAFVPINCAAIPRELLENELFGSEKGAYTGANTRKIGKFELADTGTIFLDEIADLDLDLQAKILRVLQEKTFERLGGTFSIKVDVRIVAASNQDLIALVKSNKFREDLYYRVSVFPIKLPALRERKDDIPLLVEHYVRRLKTSKTISPAAVEKLSDYDWPGNIRELENTIERANIIAQQVIQPEHILLPEIRRAVSIAPAENNLKSAGSHGKETAEAEIIRRTLEQTKGNKSEAARRLGVSYKTLLNRIARYQLKKLL